MASPQAFEEESPLADEMDPDWEGLESDLDEERGYPLAPVSDKGP